MRVRLLHSAEKVNISSAFSRIASVSSPAVVTDLPATGWTILRPGHGWELIFKCGVPCPSHLPPHVHSDQLSVDLCYRGRWLLSEAGTSIYGNSPERAYERSGSAHNVLQLGIPSPSGDLHWIEPVEVWGDFRAARKSQPRDRISGQFSDRSCFAAGSHDGYDRLGARHVRMVQLTNASPQQISLFVKDSVVTSIPIRFRLFWHFSPNASREMLAGFESNALSADDVKITYSQTWHADGFNQRIPRKSASISGLLQPGRHIIASTFNVRLRGPGF